MSDVKEGIVLDKEGRPLTETSEQPQHQRFRQTFQMRFGENAIKMRSASLPLKILLGALALVMLAVGGAIIFVSLFVFFIRLIFRALFGNGRR